ncbi:MAG: hypothetical protein M3P91_03275 [Actinomycetota bacterium]|nr:hypothetical protein [Actinomycetota bacterium]
MGQPGHTGHTPNRTPTTRAVRRAAEQRARQAATSSALDGLTGRRLPGGCDDCTAFQTVEQQASGVYVLLVHHDDTCPDYRAMCTRGTR